MYTYKYFLIPSVTIEAIQGGSDHGYLEVYEGYDMEGGTIVETFKVNIERRPAYLVMKELPDGSVGIEDHEIF